jgi:UMF1 family MFS transporter
MSPSALIVVGVLTPLSGVIGSLVWPVIQQKYHWSSQKVLVILVIMASMIPAYGCLGFLTQGRVRFGGLTTQEEMFALAVYFGEFHNLVFCFFWS